MFQDRFRKSLLTILTTMAVLLATQSNLVAGQSNSSLTVGTNFTASTLQEDPNTFPPDTMGAVGPTQYLVVINGELKLFDKAGHQAPSFCVTLNDFFASVRGSTTFSVDDPQVRYDRLSGRWFITAQTTPDSEIHGNRVVIAVSNGSTIMSTTDCTSTTW